LSPTRLASEDPLIGSLIGRYRVERLLGAGGMGRVYLAVQPQIAARAAIKVLSTSDRQLVERFFAEARAVNLIAHEAIVKVFDLAELPDGRPYIMMELVDGEPLRDILARGVPPLAGVLSVMLDVLAALDAAHAIGIVHRDLKPENIMVTAQGRGKVLDFGIAKLTPELVSGVALTKSGVRIGTPPYMSPEQIRSLPVDPRSDVYSLGIVLYEAVTGVHPFEGSNDLAIMLRHLDDLPEPPSRVRPELPAALDALIAQAIAKSPDQRFSSARAMAAAIASVLSQLPGATERIAVTPFAPTRSERVAPDRDEPPTAIERPVRDAAPAAPVPSPRRSRWWVVAGVAAAGVVGATIAIRATRAPADAPAAQPVRGAQPLPATDDPWSSGAKPEPAPPPPPTPAVTDVGIVGTHLDLLALAAAARQQARQRVPDAHLVRIVATRVNPDGTFEPHDAVVFEFEGKPGPRCWFQLVVRDGDIHDAIGMSGPSQSSCTTPQLVPRCSVSEAWRRARAPMVPSRVVVTADRWIVVPDSQRPYVTDDRCGEAAAVTHPHVQPPRPESPAPAAAAAPPRAPAPASAPPPARDAGSAACDPFGHQHGCPNTTPF